MHRFTEPIKILPFQSFILFGDVDYLEKFTDAYDTIKYYMRRGLVALTTTGNYE